jgi:hypothetical protein
VVQVEVCDQQQIYRGDVELVVDHGEAAQPGVCWMHSTVKLHGRPSYRGQINSRCGVSSERTRSVPALQRLGFRV